MTESPGAVKPHKWAEVIHAFADGRTVEGRSIRFGGKWFAAANHFLVLFGNDDYEFRIAPESVKVRYRVALVRTNDAVGRYTTTVDSLNEESDLQSSRQFIRWLTAWQEIEV